MRMILISYGFKYREQESLLEIHPSSFNFKTAQIRPSVMDIETTTRIKYHENVLDVL